MGRVYRIIDVSFNGKKESAIAIVDTGADETVISERLAKRLNVKLYGEFLAYCASQTVLRGRVADVKIKELKNNKESLMRVGVSDIPFNTDDIDEEGLDVILGIDFIQKVNLKIEI